MKRILMLKESKEMLKKAKSICIVHAVHTNSFFPLNNGGKYFKHEIGNLHGSEIHWEEKRKIADNILWKYYNSM